MARLPALKRLSKEDFPQQAEWIDQLLQPLNQFFESIHSAMDKQLSFSENLNAEVKTFELRTPSSGPFQALRVRHSLKVRPIGVLVLGATDLGAPNATIGALSVDWENAADNQISLRSVGGLANAKSYSLTLLIIGA